MSTPPIFPPVGPPAPPIPPPVGGPVITPLVNTQSTYSSSLAANEDLTIINFSSIMLSSSNEAAATAWQTQQYNAASRKDMYNAWIAQALDLVALYNKFLMVGKQYGDLSLFLFGAIASFNIQAISYNGGIPQTNSEIIAINQAISQYNAGTITAAQLQVAIDAYNTYANNRNVTIQINNIAINSLESNISDINVLVDDLNAQLAGVAKPLPRQNPYTGSTIAPLPILPPPGAPPLASLSYTPIPLPLAVYTLRPLPTGATGIDVSIASELFAPYFNLINGQFAITAEMLEKQSSFQGFVQFILSGKLPFLADAFYLPSNPVTTSGNSTAGSVSSTALTASLSAVALEGILAQNQLLASVSQEEFAVNFSRVSQQLQYLQSTLLSQIGLQAGSSALRLLEGRLPFIDLRSSPVTASLGLTLASEVGLAVSNGDLSSPVKDILARAFPHIDAASLNSLAKQLATTMELSLLLAGLFQLGQAVNQPQLVAQVLGTLPNQAALGLTTPTAAAILNDKESFDSARDILARDIVRNSNLSEEKAKAAVDNALNSSNTNVQVIGEDYSDTLIQEGIDSKRAANSQNLLNEIIRSETKGRNILNESVKDHDLSQSVLSNQSVNDIIKKNPDLTFRQLRDELTQQFIDKGATSTEALRHATALVTGIPSAALQPVSPQAFASNLQATGVDIGTKLGFNPTQAATFSNELAATATNLGAQISDHITRLTNLNNAKVDSELKDLASEYLAPTRELYVMAEKWRDPANTFLICAKTGIMDAHPQPGNYIKGIDFYV